MQDQPHACVGLRNLVQLNPEGEIHRKPPFVAHDFDVFGRLALLHAETDGETLGFERAGLFGGLPLLDPVGNGRREVVEAADDRINLFRGTQNLVLFRCVLLHF